MSKGPVKSKHPQSFRLGNDANEMLFALHKKLSISQVDVLRLAIRRFYEEEITKKIKNGVG